MNLSTTRPTFSLNLKRILTILFFINLVLGSLHYFIFIALTRSFQDQLSLALPGPSTWIALTLLSGLTLTSIGFIVSQTLDKKYLGILTWAGYLWMGAFHLLFFSCLLDFLFEFIYHHEFSYWPLVVTPLIFLWALFKGLRHPQLRFESITGPVSMQGMKLAQISDLHIGMLHLNQAWLQKIVDRINFHEPDLVAITGDLVEGPYHKISPQLEPLLHLKGNIEKFYITGNHEYIHGSGPWEKRLQELGFYSLHNENTVIQFKKASVLVAGVPDRMVQRFQRHLKSNPDLALRTPHTVDYKILLAHEPASVLDLKTETCDLILSGHTHGGQIFPFGFFVRAVQPVVKGFKTINSVLVFAHQGTGFWGPPLRWFSQSEIVLFEWK